MKTVIKLILVLMIINLSYSQDKDPAQVPFKLGEDSTDYYISADSGLFKQDRFIIGSVWETNYALDKNLRMNLAWSNLRWSSEDTVFADPNCYLIKV